MFIPSTRSSPSSPCWSSPPAKTLPSCHGSAPVACPALCSPRCHFCARVPFTLLVCATDLKPSLQTRSACDQTDRRGAGFVGGRNSVALWPWWGSATEWLRKRPTSSLIYRLRVHSWLCGLTLALFQRAIHDSFLKDHSCLTLFCEKSSHTCEGRHSLHQGRGTSPKLIPFF